MTDISETPTRELKMWLVVRTDIAMSAGKLAVQSGHAFQWHAVAATQMLPELMTAYMANPGTPKITVRAKSEADLDRIVAEAQAAGVAAIKVVDQGRTEFPEPTATVVAFGPAYRDELPPFLKRLQLYRDPLAA